MKTIKFEDKSFEVSDESYEAFRKQFEKKEGRFVPEMDGEYFFVDSDGNIDEDVFKGWGGDFFRLNTGNCFKTEEEAEKHQAKLKAIADITAYMYANDMVLDPDWDAVNQGKLRIYYNYEIENLYYYIDFNHQYQKEIPFINSIENAEKLIKEKDKELKLIFNVE